MTGLGEKELAEYAYFDDPKNKFEMRITTTNDGKQINNKVYLLDNFVMEEKHILGEVSHIQEGDYRGKVRLKCENFKYVPKICVPVL